MELKRCRYRWICSHCKAEMANQVTVQQQHSLKIELDLATFALIIAVSYFFITTINKAKVEAHLRHGKQGFISTS